MNIVLLLIAVSICRSKVGILDVANVYWYTTRDYE